MLPRCHPAMVEPGWLLSPPGRPYLASILHKNQRRVFGETPTAFPNPPPRKPQTPQKPHTSPFFSHPSLFPPPKGCWSAPRCPPPSVSPRSPTNSSCRDAAGWAKRRWWQRWLGAPRPLCTERHWVWRGDVGGLGVTVWEGHGGDAECNGGIRAQRGNMGLVGCAVSWHGGGHRRGMLGVMVWWGAQTWDPWGAWCHGVVGTAGIWGL